MVIRNTRTIYKTAMALALVLIFAALSPAACAGYHDHNGWAALGAGSGSRLEDGSYYLKDSIQGELLIKGRVELCLNGKSITGSGNGSVIKLSEGAELLLHDCAGGGCISGGSATEGGGIYLAENSSLTMDGGRISGNTANRGGGIYAAESVSLSISGGEISENQAKTGGALFLRCPAELSGLEIKGNSAEYTGAGIHAETAQGALVSLNGCSIDENSAMGHGGGAYLKNCSMEMLGGSLDGNKVSDAHASGGGVYVGENASFSMAGEASISGNSAVKEGGGVCVSSSPHVSGFSMSGGEISGNSAENGGGISSTGAGQFEISGGKISGNSAEANGGGIYISFAFTRDVEKLIANCDIDGNSAGSYGGGVYIQGNSFISVGLDGDSIRRNSAMDGGGVYVNQLERLSLAGMLHINGNKCSGRGANLYLHSSEKMSVGQLQYGSDIGLSLEYTDKSTFTTDAEGQADMLKDCFSSNIPDFGVSEDADGQLQFALACRVNFDARGGRLDSDYRMYTTGDPLGQLPVPVKDGYTFAYWDYNGRRVSSEDSVTFDKTLTANYEFNNYSVEFDPNGGSGSMAPVQCRYTVPFNLPECGFVKEGYVLTGWSLSPEGEKVYSDRESVCSLCSEAGGSVTLYARWGQPPASAISMESSFKLALGESRTLTVTAEPLGADMSDLVWESNNEKAVSVDENGLLSGLKIGKATISVSNSLGASASCTVEVGKRNPQKEDFLFSDERSFSYDGGGKAPELIRAPESMDYSLRYVRLSDGAELGEAPGEPGSYAIYIDVEENRSFSAAQGISDEAWNFSIEQGEQALSIGGIPESVYYGQAFTLTAQGGSGSGALHWQLSAGDAAIVNPETGDVYVTGTGDFTVTLTKEGDSGFAAGSASADFSASRRQLYLETQPSVVMEKSYDGSAQAQLLDMGTVAGFRPEDEGSIPVSAAASFADGSAGADKLITVSYSLGEYENYYAAPEDVYIYGGVIYPRTAEIRWNYSQPFVYNCVEQSVSAYVANALEGDSVSCAAYEGQSAVDAGTYTAVVTALDNGNYSLEGAQGLSLSWSIEPRTVTVKAADMEKSYGQPEPELSYICMDEVPPVLSGLPSRDYGEDVGAYRIGQGSLCLTDGPGFTAANYRLEFVEGLMTVNTGENELYDFYCGDVPYGAFPEPYAQSLFGGISFSYSRSPDGPFGPWDTGSAPGTWYVKASSEGSHNYTGAEAVLPFTVLKEEFMALAQPESIYVSPQGDVLNSIAAALPLELDIINSLGALSQHRAQVWWDLEMLSYDAAIQGAQALSLTGTALLPEDVNNSAALPLTVSISIYIDPTVPAAPAADPTAPPLETLPGQPVQPETLPPVDPFL